MKNTTLSKTNALKKTLSQFNNLKEYVIDSSSLIYMQKCNFLNILANNIKMITPIQAAEETGLCLNSITIINYENTRQYETDYIIVKLAVEKNIPVISEDKEILKYASDKNLAYFNSLMMLNFLFYKKVINSLEYTHFYDNLKKIAWYSSHICKYADDLHKEIISNIF